MKTSFSPHMVACLSLGLIAPLTAQNLGSRLSSLESLNPDPPRILVESTATIPGSYEVPAIERVQGEPAADETVCAAQDSSTLAPKPNTSRKVDSVVDLDVLLNPSPYRKISVSARGQSYQLAEDSLRSGLARFSATYRESGKVETSPDCSTVTLSIHQQLKLNPSQVLEIVEREIAANPGCSCELVKTAITVTEANKEEVMAIVESAIHASPESMRIISQCAIAAMPDSIAGVQALLAKLDPNAGRTGSSAKSAKSAKVASIVDPLPNPLDRPPPFFPPPPPYFPPPVTKVDPGEPCDRSYQ